MKDFIKSNKFKILLAIIAVVCALFMWARHIQNNFVPIKYVYSRENLELTFVASRIVTLEDYKITEGTILVPVANKPFTFRIDGAGNGAIRISYRDWKDRPRYGVIEINSSSELIGVLVVDQNNQFGARIASEILP